MAALLGFSENSSGVAIYNVGMGIGSSVLEVVRTFEEVNDVKVDYRIGPRREGDAAQVYADNKKILKELDWKPKFTLADGLQHAWNWQKKLNA